MSGVRQSKIYKYILGSERVNVPLQCIQTRSINDTNCLYALFFSHPAYLEFAPFFLVEWMKGLFSRVATCTGQEMVREKFFKVRKIRENFFFLEEKSGKNEVIQHG